MILLSGASGRVGSAASQALHSAGIPFRVILRDPEKFPLSKVDSIEVYKGDLENTKDLEKALHGVTAALLLMSNNSAQADIEREFARIAKRSGVTHIVKISSIEASPQATAALPSLHYSSEQFIQSLGMDWTFLRPNFYMQNMLMYAVSIKSSSYFTLPLGDASTAMVDARDVGLAAAKALTENRHRNKIYDLNGPDLMNFDMVAKRISEVIDREVRYQRQTPEQFRAVLNNFIPSSWQVDAVCELFEEIASGSLQRTGDDLEHILQKPPRDIKIFSQDFKTAFLGD